MYIWLYENDARKEKKIPFSVKKNNVKMDVAWQQLHLDQFLITILLVAAALEKKIIQFIKK